MMRKPWVRPRQWLDTMSVYLPLIVMAALALASWWLLKSVPPLAKSPSLAAQRQAPDYRLGHFSVKTFNAQGHMRTALSGDSAQHLPAREVLVVQNARLEARGDEGAQMNAQARQAVARDDGTEVVLTGQVNAMRHPHLDAPPMTLQGERMVARPKEDLLVSKDPVRMTRAQDVLTADNLHFDSNSRQYELQGRVRVTLQPQR
jgi:lipopolysaccharide export system protein LptC